MQKSAKSNQRGKSSANDAKSKAVSKSTRAKMARKIEQLNADPHRFTYEQISAAMGHESGYAHLVQKGGRVSPTKIEAQALEAMYQTAMRSSNMLRSDVDKRNRIFGMCAQIMRLDEEL